VKLPENSRIFGHVQNAIGGGGDGKIVKNVIGGVDENHH